jgi:FlaA1/EpsC-like NDP-sugar epimerase
MVEKYQFLIDFLVSSPRIFKQLILGSVDVVAVIFSLWLAYCLRLGVIYVPSENQWWIFFAAPLTAIPVFYYFGLYRAITRYIGMRAIWDIVKATALFSIVFAVVVLILKIDEFVPRTVYGILGVVTLLFVGGFRLVVRWWIGRYISKQHILSPLRQSPPVIIYGAGESGMQLVAALKLSRQLKPVAFIDDDQALQRHQINGLTVYGFERLAWLIEQNHVSEVLLAMPSMTKSQMAKIIAKLEPFPVHVRTLPSLSELAEGKVTVSDIREIDIGDLLGRDKVAPVEQLLTANILNKSVMVTGAGGSIGSELCRQIAKSQPSQLILFEQHEFALYELERELNNAFPKLSVTPVLGDVAEKKRVQAACKTFVIDTIYHAAAYKHVPMVELNTTEAIRNNIFGTQVCAEVAIEELVETFVLVSTDKAVRPTNTMGATKRFAELILQAYAEKQNRTCNTRFSMVRFGNVLGSSGSVVPLFREQIQAGGPVTVTDKRITRYFMTIPEAAELVIQAGAMGQGGDVFVLDMGEPVRIFELAQKMIHLSGFTERTQQYPEGDIEIKMTGLRPGEKLYEELLIGENVTETAHPKIMRAQETLITHERLLELLQQLKSAYQTNNVKQIRELLLNTIDGFEPQCENQDWLAESVS